MPFRHPVALPIQVNCSIYPINKNMNVDAYLMVRSAIKHQVATQIIVVMNGSLLALCVRPDEIIEI